MTRPRTFFVGRESSWFPVLAAMLYTAGVAFSFPSLRHDWFWPPVDGSFWYQIVNSLGGWNSGTGIGKFDTHPVDYVVQPLVEVAKFVIGRDAALVVFVFGIAAVVTLGARSLARNLNAGSVWLEFSAELFALYNPWTYTQTVAGHTLLILAYGAFLYIVAECLRLKPRPFVLSALCVGVFQQLQFGIPLLALFGFMGVARRQWLPFISLALLYVPIAYAISASVGELTNIPYLLEWQRGQSISPLPAALLSGYFTGYDRHVGVAAQIATGCFAVLALVGAFVGASRPTKPGERSFSVFVFAATLSATLLATGLRGPIAALYSWLFSHFVATAVYRELFDLLGFVTIGYLILSVSLARRVRFLIVVCVFAGAALPISWLGSQPSQYWVNYHVFEAARVTIPGETRFALVPSFQPLSRGEIGSGIDPDWFLRSEYRSPLNDYLAEYPENAALAIYERTGNSEPLRALSVAQVICRPELRSPNQSAQRVALGSDRGPINRPCGAADSRSFHEFRSELSLQTNPQLVSLGRDFSEDDIVIFDLPTDGIPEFHLVGAPQHVWSPHGGGSLDATRAWVDQYLSETVLPEAATEFRGAITTSRSAWLDVKNARFVLAWVDGDLYDDAGRRIQSGRREFAWSRLFSDSRRIRCHGVCAVELFSDTPVRYPLESSTPLATPIAFQQQVPWQTEAVLPAGSSALLRYNVRFDDGWTAAIDGRPLQHVRIDHSINGWVVPDRKKAERVSIVNVTARRVVGLEVVSFALWVVLIGAEVLFARRRRSDASW